MSILPHHPDGIMANWKRYYEHTAKIQNTRHWYDLSIGSILRQMVGFALPMLAGSVLMIVYSFVNAFLGETIS
jgi:hypothetical protein